jgi:uncharacterized protein YhjY with autotransporter beta-barrel domain
MRNFLSLIAIISLSAYARVTFGVQILASTVQEDDGFAVVQFVADDPVRPLTVMYSSRDGSAQAGADYQARSGVLTWQEGDNAAKTIQVPIVNDSVVENAESFAVVGSYDRGDGALVERSAAVVIEDDDAGQTGAVSLDRAKASVSEGAKIVLRAVRRGGTKGEASVDFAVRAGTAAEGVDYTAPASGTLAWADGEDGGKTIEIDALADTVADDGETLFVELSNPSPGLTLDAPAQATVTLVEGVAVNPPGLNQLEQTVAQVIDQVCDGNASGALMDRCREFNQLTDDQKRDAVQKIAPPQYTATVAQGIKLAGAQTRNLQNRMNFLRLSRYTQPVSVSFDGQNFGPFAEALAGRQTGGAAGDEESRFFDGRLGFFFQGRFQKSDKNTQRTLRATETGFASEARSMTLGMDYRFLDDLVIGLAAGYDNASLKYNDRRGSQDIDFVKGMFYGSYYLPHEFYIDWVAGYGGSDYVSKRNIIYSGFSGAAKGAPGGNQYDFGLSMGKDFSWGSWEFTPYGRFEYLEMSVDGYRESGDTGWEMAFRKTVSRSLTTTAGGRVSYALSLPWGVLTPATRFEWLHEYSNGGQTIGGQLINAAPGFGFVQTAVRTLSPDRDYFNLEGSLTATLPEGRSVFLRYESRLGQSAISSHTVEAGVRIPF